MKKLSKDDLSDWHNRLLKLDEGLIELEEARAKTKVLYTEINKQLASLRSSCTTINISNIPKGIGHRPSTNKEGPII